MVDFIKARLAERTSWDGIAICGMSLLVICAAPLVKLLAWPALVYGLWTIYQALGWSLIGVFGAMISSKIYSNNKLSVNPLMAVAAVSGFVFDWFDFLEGEPQKEDIEVDYGTFKLWTDTVSIEYLEGMLLDYQYTGINEGFTFINPNATAYCGCGESFTI